MSDETLLSVVIPTCHRNDTLALCLERLAPGAQTLAAGRYEVIVTDDGRESTAEQMIRERFAWAHWTQGPRRGPAANRNQGASLAKGAWLMFTDDDCLPDRGWLQAFVKAAASGARAMEGAIHPVGDTKQDLAECPVNLTGGCFWSANIAVERRLFADIGGFDERYTIAAHEDEDLQLRLKERTDIRFVEDARVEHPVRVRPFMVRLRGMCSSARNTALYYALNAERLGIRRYSTLVRWVYRPRLTGLLDAIVRLRPKTCLLMALRLVWESTLVLWDHRIIARTTRLDYEAVEGDR